MSRGAKTGWPAALAVTALLVACQPLPHPFADDRPPAALLRIRDSAGVAIASVVGSPPAIADKLGAAMAEALLKRDIPASDKTTSLGSYQLYGRVVEARPAKGEGETAVTALWRLYDAKGGTVGERSARLAGKAQDWAAAGGPLVAQLAALSAEKLAPLLVEAAPASAAAQPPAQDVRTRIVIGKIGGAPGDGATSLAAAIANMLRRHDLAIVEDGGKADLYVEGEVAVSPVGASQQHVKIVWHVRRADGSEIGTVGQENDIPKGQLDGHWGETAYNVAIAASDGLMQLVARGAPAPKS